MEVDVAVYGASGVVGRRAVAALAGTSHVALGRGDATLDDHAALARAFEGARVVVSCAGPDAAAPLLVAALSAGAHYVDVGGDQAALHALFERHDSTARRAGLVAAPACGVDCALGDWAAAWAAAHVVDQGSPRSGSSSDDSDPVGSQLMRDAPAPRLADDAPLDDIAVTYVIDELVATPGQQRALLRGLPGRHLAWHRDRWEPARAQARRVNAGPAFGGERDAIPVPAGDAITIPRHVAARDVQTFVAATRRPLATAALRLAALARPFVPRATRELFASYAPDDADYARTRFAVVAQARRGFAAAQVVVSGRDLATATARIAAFVARALAARGAGPVGMRAPSELFHPAAALRAVAKIAELTIEPSFA